MAKGKDTKGVDYADRLQRLSDEKWKKVLDVQRPYRWNLSRLKLGKTLDVGCGIGRNLGNLSKDSVGVDHNKHSVKVAKDEGYNAVTVEEFKKDKKKYGKDSFDSMLLAHVLEHLSTDEGVEIIKSYLPYVKDKVVVICPQQKGFKTDDTHVNFLTHEDIYAIMVRAGLKVEKTYSFPFARPVGHVFKYNETVVVARKP